MKNSILLQGIQREFPHEELQKWGCYFFTLCVWAMMMGGRIFTNNTDLIAYYEKCKNNNWINNKCKIVNPAAILNGLGIKPQVTEIKVCKKIPDDPFYADFVEHPRWGAHFVLRGQNGYIWDSYAFRSLSDHVHRSYRIAA